MPCELTEFTLFTQGQCDEKDSELDYLSTFKKGYDDLNDAFLSQSAAILGRERSRFNSFEPRDAVIASRKVSGSDRDSPLGSVAG